MEDGSDETAVPNKEKKKETNMTRRESTDKTAPTNANIEVHIQLLLTKTRNLLLLYI